MRNAVIVSTLALVALAGCSSKETVSSDNIRTQGIAAEFNVEAPSATQSRVRATLRVGGDESNTYVILDGGDALRAEVDGNTYPMSAQSEGVYEADVPAGAENTEFKIMLDRSQDDDAMNSSGLLPRPFDITTTPTTNPSRATEEVVIEWDNSGAQGMMSIEINGPCIFKWDNSNVADTGSYTIPAGELNSTGGDNPEACSLEVEIKRTLGGSADPLLDNESEFTLIQSRRANFDSAP